MAEITLADLLRGLGEAVRGAQVDVEAHSLDEYRKLLDGGPSDAAGGAQPQMIGLPLPRLDGSYATRNIPVATLMHHYSVVLDEVRIRFSARLGWNEREGKVTVELAAPKKPLDTEGSEAPVAEIELLLKRGDTPEGTARATQELLKAI